MSSYAEIDIIVRNVDGKKETELSFHRPKRSWHDPDIRRMRVLVENGFATVGICLNDEVIKTVDIEIPPE